MQSVSKVTQQIREPFLRRVSPGVSPEPLSGWQDGGEEGVWEWERGYGTPLKHPARTCPRKRLSFPGPGEGEGVGRVPGARGGGTERQLFPERASLRLPVRTAGRSGLPTLFGQSSSNRTGRCPQRKPPSGSGVIHRLRGRAPASGNCQRQEAPPAQVSWPPGPTLHRPRGHARLRASFQPPEAPEPPSLGPGEGERGGSGSARRQPDSGRASLCAQSRGFTPTPHPLPQPPPPASPQQDLGPDPGLTKRWRQEAGKETFGEKPSVCGWNCLWKFGYGKKAH